MINIRNDQNICLFTVDQYCVQLVNNVDPRSTLFFSAFIVKKSDNFNLQYIANKKNSLIDGINFVHTMIIVIY